MSFASFGRGCIIFFLRFNPKATSADFSYNPNYLNWKGQDRFVIWGKTAVVHYDYSYQNYCWLAVQDSAKYGSIATWKKVSKLTVLIYNCKVENSKKYLFKYVVVSVIKIPPRQGDKPFMYVSPLGPED